MAEGVLIRGRSGWAPGERELLWQEVERAGREGGALRGVFESVAQKTGRKPNSIRNYYYIAIKNGEAPNGVAYQKALPFMPFDGDETHSMVREILRARAGGESVRACVLRLGGGDKAKTLRYQNKYRSVLKTRPEYIRSVMDELAAEGVEFGDAFTPVRRKKKPAAPLIYGQSTALDELMARLEAGAPHSWDALEALCEFLRAAGRSKSE